MKKSLGFAALVLFTVNMIPGASLTLIQPNGGDLCLGQENYQIRWTAVGVSEKIKLVLFRNDVKIASIAENLDAGGSPYLWKVGQHIGGTAPAGGGYKVRIRTMSNGIDDFSDAAFVLKTSSPPCQPPLPPPPPPVLLRLETPNGGESFILHHETTISWKSISPAAVGSVQLELVRYQGSMLGVIKDNLPATGSFTWKAGEYPGNTAPIGKYQIRVRSMNDATISDPSDSFFNLKMQAFANAFDRQPLLRQPVSVPGVYKNWPGKDKFPSTVTGIPPSVYDGVWNQITPAVCYAGGSNHTALAGIYWFPYLNVQVAVVYRSRIIFYLSEHVKPGATLKSAMLKMKRIHSIHEDANSGCGCSESLWVLKAPWNSYDIPAIGPRVDVDMGAVEFTRDITEIVKQWLDGTVVNNGLLLLAGELPCSGGRKCFSCYEASLILNF